MIIFGPLLVILGIGFFCWLLFTLAVFALPFFAGLTIGIWAFHAGAGVLDGPPQSSRRSREESVP